MAIATTLDGYKYIPIYRQPTTMNTMCVYRILKDNEDPVYFLASSELRERFIRMSTFNEMKTHMMPQHFEGFFKDEFTAVLMAKNIAMNRYIELQKLALDEAEMTITKAKKEELNKHSSDITWEGYDAYNRYYAAQDALRKEARDRLLALKNEMRKDDVNVYTENDG